jgi:hypothetical protein
LMKKGLQHNIGCKCMMCVSFRSINAPTNCKVSTYLAVYMRALVVYVVQ